MPKKWFRTKMLTVLGVQGILLLLVLGVLATPALAHRVLVFATASGDTIFTESKFIPNDPVRQGKVEVQDAKTGQVLLTGTTNDQGKFSFKIPAEAVAQKMDLKIVTVAAMGHRGEWLLKAANYLAGAQEGAGTPAPAPAAATSEFMKELEAIRVPETKTTHPATATPAPAEAPSKESIKGKGGAPINPATTLPEGHWGHPVEKTSGVNSVTIDQQVLEAALNKALERQLAPINEKLTDLTIHRTTLPDILGGIGYILGLCGVGAYFLSKRQKNT